MISLSSPSVPPEPAFLSNLGLGGKTARPPETAIAQVIAPTGKAADALMKLREAYAKPPLPALPASTLDVAYPLDDTAPLSKIEQIVAAFDHKIGKMILGVDPASPVGSVTAHATSWNDLKIIEDTTLGLGDLLVAPRQAGKSRLQETMAQILKSETVISQKMVKAFQPYPYQKQAMDWLMSKDYAMATRMIEPFSGGRYNDAVRRYEQHVQSMRFKIGDLAYYLPPTEPHLRNIRPEIAQLFIWGPEGEWTGCWMPDSSTLGRAAELQNRYIELGYALRLNTNPTLIRGGGRHYDFRDIYDPKYDRDRVFEDYPEHCRFADYEDWAIFEHDVLGISSPASANTRRLARHLSALNIEPTVLLEWTTMLGKAKFGYGVLRDGKDRCDAFGVLATMNDAPWAWDPKEGAWAIDGSCYDVKPERLAGWLGIGPRGVADLEPFFDTITEMSDGATSFKPLTAALSDATSHAASTRAAYQEFLSDAQRHHGSHLSLDALGRRQRRFEYDYIPQMRVHDEIMLENRRVEPRQPLQGFIDMEEDVLDPEIFGDEA
ncbi:hypothetical protein CcrSwift_gp150 [Caulobacter phage CcrSwift]|uniref:Uncharacterized protein n=1 Tax=Caulobacter phage CcrSwift TaxID=2927984 RepID=K4JX21_9CAUD|nr:hypothetical protein D870_gp271 [Caulobacter phage CcrSwift]AFU88468.1 hypothetical protein CcrSwift_gp150 [Caulobacter phage CcrSwift]